MTDWDTILANNGPAVWNTLWRLIANRTDVEECFQETFLSALKLSQRQTVDCWPAVLCSLATARAMDRLRQRYRRRAIRDNSQVSSGQLLSDAPSTAAGPVEQAEAAELSERLRHALAQLPEKQAEVFYLHAICGWSQGDVGQRMQMTENAVGVSIHRARQRLKQLLSDSQ